MAKRKHQLTICLLFVITFFSACMQKEPVTEAEAKAAAAVIEKAARNQKSDALFELIDLRMLRENVGKQNSKLSVMDINAAVSEDALKQFASKVVQSVKSGSYKMINTYDTAGVRHVIFRMYGDDGLNYHDFPLYKINGKVKAADVFNFITGEDISKTFAGLLGADPSMTGDGSSGAGKQFLKLIAQKNKNDYDGELETIGLLTPAVRKTKVVQMINIEASRHKGNDAYTAALEEFANLYPNEPNTYLMMLDAYYLNKEYDKALFAVDKLDTLVKGDPLLNLFRGNLYREISDTAKSLAAFEKCFAYDPYIKNNMQQLVVTYAEVKDIDKAKAVIEKYKQNPRFQEEDISVLYQLHPELK